MPCILIVDDDAQVLRLLQLNLEMEGYDVLSAANGPAALDLAATKAPDLVICDVMMPGMTGYEVVRRLRADAGTAKVPVVMLSAKAMRSEMREGLDAGADEYVTKPFDPTELLDVISRLLAKRSRA